jgi:hypothetical protein
MLGAKCCKYAATTFSTFIFKTTTMYLCTCGNCSTVLIDRNPGDNSIEYPDSIINEQPIRNMKLIRDVETGERYWVCPSCDTDDYLIDNLHILK